MPVTASTPSEIFIGAGEVYVDDVAVGATQDNNVFRVVREYFTPELNGVRGPLSDMDYVQSETAELEVTVPELAADKLALAVPGAVSTVNTSSPNDAAGGGNTTVALNANAGDTNVKVTAVTNLAIGDVIRIGPAGSTQETHKITAVGTAGAGGTGIDLATPLAFAHPTPEAFVEVDGGALAADALAGATNIKVTAAALTNLVAGDFIKVGVQGDYEIRKVQIVGTAGAGGTGLTLYIPLTRFHRLGDLAIEVTNEGDTTIETSTTRRVPSASYHKWELRVPGLNGREVRFGIRKGLMTESPEFEAQDDGTLAPRLTIQARWDPASPATSPWYIQRIPASS